MGPSLETVLDHRYTISIPTAWRARRRGGDRDRTQTIHCADSETVNTERDWRLPQRWAISDTSRRKTYVRDGLAGSWHGDRQRSVIYAASCKRLEFREEWIGQHSNTMSYLVKRDESNNKKGKREKHHEHHALKPRITSDDSDFSIAESFTQLGDTKNNNLHPSWWT